MGCMDVCVEKDGCHLLAVGEEVSGSAIMDCAAPPGQTPLPALADPSATASQHGNPEGCDYSTAAKAAWLLRIVPRLSSPRAKMFKAAFSSRSIFNPQAGQS